MPILSHWLSKFYSIMLFMSFSREINPYACEKNKLGQKADVFGTWALQGETLWRWKISNVHQENISLARSIKLGSPGVKSWCQHIFLISSVRIKSHVTSCQIVLELAGREIGCHIQYPRCNAFIRGREKPSTVAKRSTISALKIHQGKAGLITWAVFCKIQFPWGIGKLIG